MHYVYISVPSSEISNVTQGETTATSHSVTVTLPLTMYPPEELLIISSVSPPDSVPTMVNFTGPLIKYTVTFNNLKPATDYIFSIRIVLRTDNTLNVVAPVTGTFTTAPSKSIYINYHCNTYSFFSRSSICNDHQQWWTANVSSSLHRHSNPTCDQLSSQ